MSLSRSASGTKPIEAKEVEAGFRSALIDEVLAVLVPALGELDLDTTSTLAGIERFVRDALRRLGGVLSARLADYAAAKCPRPACPACARTMEIRNRRERHLCGLTGDLALGRTEYVCRSCREVRVPAEEMWELGPGCLSPELSRVVAAACAEIPSFERAAELVGEVLGVTITADTAGRTSEAIGAVAEQQLQQAMAAGDPPVPEMEEEPLVLMVGMDACKAHAGGRWRDVKVGVTAPLGPQKRADKQTGRVSLVLGPRTYCAAIEDADRFYDRVLLLARRAGWHPARRMQVVLIGDGGPWIWARADRLRAGGIEVIEILDIYHAREHIWNVAHSVLGTGASGHQWGEALAAAVLEHGAKPVLKALGALVPRGPKQRDVVRQAIAYFQDNAERMHYSTYLAKGLPLGSGVVESSCRLVSGLRCKQPGMRWSLAGVQSILTLRAERLSQCGQWDELWASAPQRRRPPVRTLTKTDDQAA